MPAERTVIEAFLEQEIALRVDPWRAEFLNVLDGFIKPLQGPKNGRTDEVGARQFRRWLRGKDARLGSQPRFCRALAQGAIR